MLKKMLIGVGVFVILAVGVFVWQKNRAEPFVPRDFDKVVVELGGDPKKIEAYTKRLVEAYKNDGYGGDTPEETLNLFIDALKAGDTDLAAKYFLLEEQERMKEELKQGVESGGIVSFLESVAKEKSGFPTGESIYTFEIPAPDDSKFILELVLNPYTKKWKIENL